MKARSKAARRKHRAGRRRLSEPHRTKTGRVSRAGREKARRKHEREGDTVAIAIEARQQVHGIGKMNALRPEAGYALGRLYLAGRIELHHLRAGNRYAEDVVRYYRLVGIPLPTAHAHDLDRVRGCAGEDDTARGIEARQAADRWQELNHALLSTRDGRQVASVVHNCCVCDDGDMWPVHMVAWLQRGLDELAEFYRVPSENGC